MTQINTIDTWNGYIPEIKYQISLYRPCVNNDIALFRYESDENKPTKTSVEDLYVDPDNMP